MNGKFQPAEEIKGVRWGSLTALRVNIIRGQKGGQQWIFKCDCGNEKLARLSLVKHGFIDSCGCKPAPRAKRAYQISWYFGVSLEAATELAIRTEGVCDVCKRPERARTRGGILRMLNIDHCHATLKVRGVLCSDCNISIGHSDDDPQRLRALATYLERYAK
jgi:hypothetical protein